MQIQIQTTIILGGHLNEIKGIANSIQESISSLKKLEEFNVVSDIMEYRSRNKEYSKLPPKVSVLMATFHPKTINSDQMCDMFGSLKYFDMRTDKNGYSLKKP